LNISTVSPLSLYNVRMKIRLFILTLAVWLNGGVAVPFAKALDLEGNARQSTVFISSYDFRGNLLLRGSGFYVDEGIIITNKHVVDGAARYYRIFTTGENGAADFNCYKDITRSDVKINLDDDIAYLRAFIKCPHGSVYFADTNPKVGEGISVLGYPAITGFSLYSATGTVLEKVQGGTVFTTYDGFWLRTDAKIHGGNSGGPVLQNGMVVGVAVASHKNEWGYAVDGYFVPVTEILRGLESANKSSFAYTPQIRQKNDAYIEKPEVPTPPQWVYGDPFNPKPAIGTVATKGDCVQSLGEGGEETGYVLPNQGNGCRCKPSYHPNEEQTTCLPGSPSYAEEQLRMQEARKKKQEAVRARPTPPAFFTDIDTKHPYREAIEWGKKSEILEGYSDGTFRPEQEVNRVEFLKILLEAVHADLSSVTEPAGFRDTNENAWYAPYVRYAKARGILQGYADGTLRPEQQVNFAEALKIAYETVGTQTTDEGGEWYARYALHARRNNILFKKSVRMEEPVRRKDVMWIVWKLMSAKNSERTLSL